MNSALITISQSTKDGKMRGSYEIIHDSDIAVAASGGIAENGEELVFRKRMRVWDIWEKKWDRDYPMEYREGVIMFPNCFYLSLFDIWQY